MLRIRNLIYLHQIWLYRLVAFMHDLCKCLDCLALQGILTRTSFGIIGMLNAVFENRRLTLKLVPFGPWNRSSHNSTLLLDHNK